MSNIITAKHITKRFTAHTALDDVSVEIPAGSVYGLLGPNGAGKTTLIRVINRITIPDQGEVLFEGKPITEQDIYRIGYLPEERGLYKKMKVGEHAVFLARLKGLSRHEALVRLKDWFVRFGIEDWWNKKVEDLSKGMAQKVQFIVTVLHTPKLLIFDEPFSGFDAIVLISSFELTMPIFTASGRISSNTASICCCKNSGVVSCTPLTPVVFCSRPEERC